MMTDKARAALLKGIKQREETINSSNIYIDKQEREAIKADIDRIEEELALMHYKFKRDESGAIIDTVYVGREKNYAYAVLIQSDGDFPNIKFNGYKTKESAIDAAISEWSKLSEYEKRHIDIVAIEYDLAKDDPLEGYTIIWDSEEEEA